MSAELDTGAMSGKVAHLQASISLVLLPNCFQGAWLCLGALLLQTSQCHPAFSSVSSSTCLLACGWNGWLCGGTCAKADSLLPYLLQSGRSWAKSAALLAVGGIDE